MLAVAEVIAAKFRGLVFQKRAIIAGVRCSVYASSFPSDGAKQGEVREGGRWGDRVVLFCHGGAFIANLQVAS